MTLHRLQPGQRFSLTEAPELGTATLILCNDCRALIRWDKQPSYQHFFDKEGKEREFYAAVKAVSITPFVNVQRVR